MCTRNQAEEILHSVYHACSPIFGRIHDAYLYGSYARGDFNSESDIDILLTVDLEQAEIAKHRNDVAKVTSRLSLEHDITVSVTVKPLEQFRRYQTALPYYRNVVPLCRSMNERLCRRRGWNTQLNAFPRQETYLKQGIIRVQRIVPITRSSTRCARCWPLTKST